MSTEDSYQITMRSQSNDANPEISIEDFFVPKISVDRASGKVHLFFGKSPRAQISVSINHNWGAEHAIALIKTKFPAAQISNQ